MNGVGHLVVMGFVVVVTASSCADGKSGNNDNQNANQVDAQVEGGCGSGA